MKSMHKTLFFLTISMLLCGNSLLLSGDKEQRGCTLNIQSSDDNDTKDYPTMTFGASPETLSSINNINETVEKLANTLDTFQAKADPATLKAFENIAKSIQGATNAQIKIVIPAETFAGAAGFTLATIGAVDMCYHGRAANYDYGLVIAGALAMCAAYYSSESHTGKIAPAIHDASTQTSSVTLVSIPKK